MREEVSFSRDTHSRFGDKLRQTPDKWHSAQGDSSGWVFLCFNFLMRHPRQKSLYSFLRSPIYINL